MVPDRPSGVDVVDDGRAKGGDGGRGGRRAGRWIGGVGGPGERPKLEPRLEGAGRWLELVQRSEVQESGDAETDDGRRVLLAGSAGRRGAEDAAGRDARAGGGAQIPPVEDAPKVGLATLIHLRRRRSRVDVGAGRRAREGSTTRCRSRDARCRDGRREYRAHVGVAIAEGGRAEPTVDRQKWAPGSMSVSLGALTRERKPRIFTKVMSVTTEPSPVTSARSRCASRAGPTAPCAAPHPATASSCSSRGSPGDPRRST